VRFLDLAVALGFVVSPVLYVLAKRRSKRSVWYPIVKALPSGNEQIGIARDTLAGQQFVKIGPQLCAANEDYDQQYSEVWARAMSATDTHNATLRRRKRR
jgi:hypothetical protein